MNEKLLWLLGFVALYWAYCIYLGIRGARLARTASDYFLAGRNLPVWVFVLAATAISFSGWTFLGHPAMIYRDGFPYAYISFFTIMIPLTGVIFLKRQWMLGKRFGYVTPGEMLSDYYKCDRIRFLTVIVAVLFTVPFMGVQLGAAGYLFNVLSDGLISTTVGTLLLGMAVFLYVVYGGMRAVAYADSFQCILLAVGVILTGGIAIYAIGGVENLLISFERMGSSEFGLWGTTKGAGGGNYNSYLAVPGIMQGVSGVEETTYNGGPWTGMMILTFLMAMMGVQASPAFSMWSFGNNTPKPFAPQQVWVSGLILGGLLFIVSIAQGMSTHLLGATPSLAGSGVPIDWKLPTEISDIPDTLVPYILTIVQDNMPWLVAFLGVCALAGMQSAGAAYMSTAGAMLTRDVYKHRLQPQAGHSIQKFVARVSVLIILLAALVVALTNKDTLVLLGGMAVAFGLQMWPALLGVCWIKWFTARGVSAGLIVGLLAVFFTDNYGVGLLNLIGLDLWGRWPLTIHSGGWGIALNLLVCIVVSATSQQDGTRDHKSKFHTFLKEHAGLAPNKRKLIPLAWGATLIWVFFAIGPGVVVGNDAFGAPDVGRDGWTFGIPSIWAWQIMFWLLGVALLWFLAYFMEMSTVPEQEIEALSEDIGDPGLDDED
ncbi:Na+/solute symporter [Candidatus Terasakiella magnetica]|uniref:Na+/solute symporter n=1 Tax=Candidatus Terasakiella magnetica TaxID=1867952 RepID=A0A1C3RJ92_9PROT|nr:sodium:solute symporter family protein [Candidatus Terasakiella magnetica]SCA57319.1 Na+/solute symporter [Candidatus Terasakiella magnetica]